MCVLYVLKNEHLSNMSTLSRKTCFIKVMKGGIIINTPHSHFKNDSNLVDPASSHTLVSKIKPCMCKNK